MADINGLWEFETATDSFIAHHFPANGSRGAKPFSTPKEDFILLVLLVGSGDGGNDVKVFKPGTNGAASVEVGMINAFSDVAFIEDESRNIAIFTSILNYYIVLVLDSVVTTGVDWCYH